MPCQMDRKPFVLITNDDGISAPGINHLWRGLVDKVDLAIVAPATEQSGVGLGFTTRNPLHVMEVLWDRGTPAWKVSGTPADCVRMAISVILGRVPDLIVSGINRGANPGRVVLYSGTVAGVIEGVFRGIPGIAFSAGSYNTPDYKTAEDHVYSMVSYVLNHPLPKGTLLNVNFPEFHTTIKGFKMTRQGRGYFIEEAEKRLHPEGYPYYWLSCKWSDEHEDEENEVTLLKEGYVTAVPIHVDTLTDEEHLNNHKLLFEKSFNSVSLSDKGSLKGVQT
jgi:5'-nucleotidase